MEKTGSLNHLEPTLGDYTNLLTFNAFWWSDYTGENWSERAFFG
jgi:hypothetical protein